MDFSPLSGREYPRFSALRTFFRLPYVDMQESFHVGIMGIPFDGGLSYRPGARFAPASIRDISSLGRGYHSSYKQNIFETFCFADLGDCPTVPLSLEKSYTLIEDRVTQVLNTGKKLFSVGGDHSITLPILRAYKKKYQIPLNLIHFDAHLDTYPAAWGCDYHHGSFLRHALEENLVNPQGVLQIGIRGPFSSAQDLDFSKEKGFLTLSPYDIKVKGFAYASDFLKQISSLVGPTYVTFDIDCLDPAYAPGTGTPVVGGFTTFEAQYLLRELAHFKKMEVVGGDLVEVSPPFDQSQITALAAADISFEILSLMALTL
jgi:guanidinopropionase